MSDKLSSEGLKAAADTTKQIITLATGVIALTVTFLEKIVQPQATAAARTVPCTMFAAWVSFGLAILAAVITLGAVTGTLDVLDRKTNGLSLTEEQEAAINALSSGSNIKIPATAMLFFFIFGMTLTIVTGFLLLR
jgi:hypothetical protein